MSGSETAPTRGGHEKRPQQRRHDHRLVPREHCDASAPVSRVHQLSVDFHVPGVIQVVEELPVIDADISLGKCASNGVDEDHASFASYSLPSSPESSFSFNPCDESSHLKNKMPTGQPVEQQLQLGVSSQVEVSEEKQLSLKPRPSSSDKNGIDDGAIAEDDPWSFCVPPTSLAALDSVVFPTTLSSESRPNDEEYSSDPPSLSAGRSTSADPCRIQGDLTFVDRTQVSSESGDRFVFRREVGGCHDEQCILEDFPDTTENVPTLETTNAVHPFFDGCSSFEAISLPPAPEIRPPVFPPDSVVAWGPKRVVERSPNDSSEASVEGHSAEGYDSPSSTEGVVNSSCGRACTQDGLLPESAVQRCDRDYDDSLTKESPVSSALSEEGVLQANQILRNPVRNSCILSSTMMKTGIRKQSSLRLRPTVRRRRGQSVGSSDLKLPTSSPAFYSRSYTNLSSTAVSHVEDNQDVAPMHNRLPRNFRSKSVATISKRPVSDSESVLSFSAEDFGESELGLMQSIYRDCEQEAERSAETKLLGREISSFLATTRSTLGSADILWTKGKLLGAGAFGKVYSAIDLESGERMAVKQLEFPLDESRAARLKKELAMVANEITTFRSLVHVNIVRYRGAAQFPDYEGGCFRLDIFMDLVEGGSLSGFIGNGLREDTVRALAYQVLDGLSYLHERAIVHRDIKPGNILLSNVPYLHPTLGYQKTVKIADFGASRSLAELVSMTMGGAVSLAGTPQYMAPEVARQTGHGRLADVWSLGCTMIEAFAGEPPWGDLFSINILLRLATTEEVPRIPLGISENATDFVRMCLTYNFRERPRVSALLRHRWFNLDQVEWISSSLSDIPEDNLLTDVLLPRGKDGISSVDSSGHGGEPGGEQGGGLLDAIPTGRSRGEVFEC